MKKYNGSCHCKKVQFEINATIDHTRICNCSICHQRGALVFRVDENNFSLKTNIEELNVYEWHTKTAKDYFCKTCGILPFRRPRTITHEEIKEGMKPFTGWSVNLRCIDNIELDKLKIVQINGNKLL